MPFPTLVRHAKYSHTLFPAQREANLRIRLNEFLRVGLAAGVFYET